MGGDIAVQSTLGQGTSFTVTLPAIVRAPADEDVAADESEAPGPDQGVDATRADRESRVDVLIFGGGGAGLWLLDELHRAGHRVMLAECDALGAGQTVASQGIIHGGLKYTLPGAMKRKLIRRTNCVETLSATS